MRTRPWGVGRTRLIAAAGLALAACLLSLATAAALGAGPQPLDRTDGRQLRPDPAFGDRVQWLDRAFGDGGRPRLDPTFGDRGRAIAAVPPSAGGWVADQVRMAQAPGGGIVVADSSTAVRFRPDGRLDASFGAGAPVPLPLPIGAEFTLAGLAVDAQGRSVLAGTLAFAGPTTYIPAGAATPERLEQVALIRLLADGRPDPGFGSGGLLATDLGLPAPAYYSSGSRSGPVAARVSGFALDSAGRIVLTGTLIAAITNCRASSPIAVTDAYLARLTPEGALDPTFANGGTRVDTGLGWVGSPLLDSRGNLTYAGSRNSYCEGSGPGGVGRLDPAGNADRRFDGDGWRSLAPAGEPRALAFDRRGRVLALSCCQPGAPGRGPKRAKASLASLSRLAPAGALDRGFGRRGRVVVQVPGRRSWLSALAVDRHGGVLLAGIRVKPHLYSAFLATRYTAAGALDRGFGAAGVVETRFGANSTAGARQVLLAGPNRFLLVGPLASPSLPTGQGVAVFRFRQ